MANLKSNILTVTEPSVSWLDKLTITDRESEEVESSIKISKFIGMMIPYVVINGMEISMNMLVSMELNSTGFLPTIRLKLNDPTNLFTGRHFPKDGDVISVEIRANNEEVFKPIRIDFDILQVDPIFSTSANVSSSYVLTGQMKIPNLLSEECKSYNSMNSYDTLLEVSQELGIGFASNEDGAMQDLMNWINPFDTKMKFIKDIVSNSYKDDKSFYSACIDQYYLLNFVNMNLLFTTEEDIEESEIYLLNFGDMNKNSDEDTGQGKAPLMLTNLLQWNGTSNYVSKYRMINNSGTVFLTNGYKRYAQWFDINDNGKNGQFINEYVDPLTTEGTDDKIHLKGRYVGPSDNRQPEGIKDTHIKHKWLGKQHAVDIGNMHDNFLFSNILNFQNNQEIFKMGMIIDLDMVNTTLYRYQRIPVFIWDYGLIEKRVHELGEEENGSSEELEENEKDNTMRPKLNKFLSGFYVIVGIDYIFTYPGPIRQRLVLIKREFDSVG